MNAYKPHTFYLAKHGGKYHLPYWPTETSENYAACRPSIEIEYGMLANRCDYNVLELGLGLVTKLICGRCAALATIAEEES